MILNPGMTLSGNHPERAAVLVVDDEVSILRSVSAILVKAGLDEPALVSNSEQVMELLANRRFRVVLLDLMMPKVDGLTLLGEIKAKYPDIECIILTAMDDVPSAVRATKLGAYEYLVKPVDGEKLVLVIRRALEKADLRRQLSLFETPPDFRDLAHPEAFDTMVAEDEKMALVFHLAEAAAPTDYSVLLSGESGTGKELLARIIHKLSLRSEGPFVALNMAGLNQAIFENELFGHEKGAFTGAQQEAPGFFEAARGGTLFLDEITELEYGLQAKLLRVIQEKEIYRLGSTKRRPIDVRLMAATNRNIKEEIAGGRFRADLYYRLNMCRLHIPPLRERPRDIAPLARHFLKIHSGKIGKHISALEPVLDEALRRYEFPGNVRELENMISSAVLVEKGQMLRRASFQDSSQVVSRPKDRSPRTLAEVEKHHILDVLELAGGNRSQAARILDIGLRTLHRKLKEYGGETASPSGHAPGKNLSSERMISIGVNSHSVRYYLTNRQETVRIL